MDPDDAFLYCVHFITDEENSVDWYRVPDAECLRPELEPDYYCTMLGEWCPHNFFDGKNLFAETCELIAPAQGSGALYGLNCVENQHEENWLN